MGVVISSPPVVQAGSMKALVMKILGGRYPRIPSHYSPELRNLVDKVVVQCH